MFVVFFGTKAIIIIKTKMSEDSKLNPNMNRLKGVYKAEEWLCSDPAAAKPTMNAKGSATMDLPRSPSKP